MSETAVSSPRLLTVTCHKEHSAVAARLAAQRGGNVKCSCQIKHRAHLLEGLVEADLARQRGVAARLHRALGGPHRVGTLGASIEVLLQRARQAGLQG